MKFDNDFIKFVEEQNQANYQFGLVPQALILLYLRNIFGNFSENNLFKWDPIPQRSKIAIELAPPDVHMQMNKVPALYVSRGALNFMSYGHRNEIASKNQIAIASDIMITTIIITTVGRRWEEVEDLGSYVLGAFLYPPKVEEYVWAMFPKIPELYNVQTVYREFSPLENFKDIGNPIIKIDVQSFEPPIQLHPEGHTALDIWYSNITLQLTMQNYWVIRSVVPYTSVSVSIRPKE